MCSHQTEAMERGGDELDFGDFISESERPARPHDDTVRQACLVDHAGAEGQGVLPPDIAFQLVAESDASEVAHPTTKVVDKAKHGRGSGGGVVAPIGHASEQDGGTAKSGRSRNAEVGGSSRSSPKPRGHIAKSSPSGVAAKRSEGAPDVGRGMPRKKSLMARLLHRFFGGS